METNYTKIADLLFPDVDKTPDYYLSLYPRRKLKDGAIVTRFAPSPTGYVHMGSLLTSFYDYVFAKQSGGVFYLRIEDTDLERTVENGVEGIIRDLKAFDIKPDEGVDLDKNSYGPYGPYIQTERAEIYRTFAKSLVAQGKAYPCFCTKDEIDAIRHTQEANGESQIGYYGKYAKCRNLTFDEIKAKVDAGLPFVIRLKSTANVGDRVKFTDKIRGQIEMSDSINDVIILKSNGLPPYNFAHAIDDYLMGTTVAIRSNEWLNNVPEHMQIFKALGFPQVEYAHVAFIQKIDETTGTKRKISKRKDPETAVSSMLEAGYPTQSVHEYLYTLANTNFEEWRLKNPHEDLYSFPFTFEKISLSGALFDIDKFNDVSKRVISNMTEDEVYHGMMKWAEQYDKEWAKIISQNPDYTKAFLSIDRHNQNPRKDIAKYSDTKALYSYFFDELFDGNYEVDDTFRYSDIKPIFEEYMATFDPKVDKDTWFNNIKAIGAKYGYASNVKDYKRDPASYHGHCGTVCNYIRVALTGRKNSPDLYSICLLLGRDRMNARLKKFLDLYCK